MRITYLSYYLISSISDAVGAVLDLARINKTLFGFPVSSLEFRKVTERLIIIFKIYDEEVSVIGGGFNATVTPIPGTRRIFEYGTMPSPNIYRTYYQYRVNDTLGGSSNWRYAFPVIK